MQIRGTQHLVIYSLPGRKEFYPEVLTKLSFYVLCLKLYCERDSKKLSPWSLSSFQLVNMLGESMNGKCNVLFSRLDILKVRSLFHIVWFHEQNYSLSSAIKFMLQQNSPGSFIKCFRLVCVPLYCVVQPFISYYKKNSNSYCLDFTVKTSEENNNHSNLSFCL